MRSPGRGCAAHGTRYTCAHRPRCARVGRPCLREHVLLREVQCVPLSGRTVCQAFVLSRRARTCSFLTVVVNVRNVPTVFWGSATHGAVNTSASICAARDRIPGASPANASVICCETARGRGRECDSSGVTPPPLPTPPPPPPSAWRPSRPRSGPVFAGLRPSVGISAETVKIVPALVVVAGDRGRAGAPARRRERTRIAPARDADLAEVAEAVAAACGVHEETA